MFMGTMDFGQPINARILLIRIIAAMLLGALIGIDREIKGRPAGMRTHVLVCLGACIVALIEHQSIACVLALNASGLVNVSMGRITNSVISGVGFLGAGTIFTAQHKIAGLTTAASLWCTACIGLAVGQGFIILGVLATVIILAVLRLMQRIVHVNTLKRLEVQFVHRAETLAFLNEYFTQMGVHIIDVDFHAESNDGANLYTNLYTLSMPNHTSYVDLIGALSENKNILTVRTRNL